MGSLSEWGWVLQGGNTPGHSSSPGTPPVNALGRCQGKRTIEEPEKTPEGGDVGIKSVLFLAIAVSPLIPPRTGCSRLPQVCSLLFPVAVTEWLPFTASHT